MAKHADEALRESEDRLAVAMSATQSGIFDFDIQNVKVTWSDAAKYHFGLSSDANVSYQTLLRAAHPEDRARVEELFETAMRPEFGGRYAAQYRAIGVEDGVERWLSVSGRVVFGSDGWPVRFIGVTQDITALKRLEDQMRQAQKLEGIGQLAGGVAHDFNNLITVIAGYAQMALDELPSDHPIRDCIEEIQQAGLRATGLTRQLLTFSRRQASESRPVVMNELVCDFERMLNRLVGEDIELILSLDPEAGLFRADPGQIEQVIMNLVINARDAMPNGGRIFLETATFFADEEYVQLRTGLTVGPHVTLSVSDTGSGMSDEVKAHIFEPFFTTKEAGKGTGLGLSTVYGIVTQSGGTISVYSEPGHGSTFKMLFPAIQPEPQTITQPSIPAPKLGYETILLTEDEAGVRRYVKRILERAGYQLLEAGNGCEALDVARQHRGPIHLLITDIVMPEMGGVDLVSQFSSIRPEVPVLCMSGYSDRLWRRGEMSGYIQKPFTPKALLVEVRSMLDAAESAA
jgi:PAS domain S-box-containing protein